MPSSPEHDDVFLHIEKCGHANRFRAIVEFGFSRPAEPNSPYGAPVSALICKTCGHIELYADMAQFVGAWLEKR